MSLLISGKPKNAAGVAPLGGRYRPARRAHVTQAPLRRALQMQRFGVIDRHGERWSDQPGFDAVRQAAAAAIDAQFALVPECRVLLTPVSFRAGGPAGGGGVAPSVKTGGAGKGAAAATAPTVIGTSAYLLNRCTVTQSEFQSFVDDDGYTRPEFWAEAVWPHLSGFVDLTGANAPAGWVNGRHDRRLARYPVTGVCFHEAAAYARWAGYRLPNEAEWQAAATWSTIETGGTGRRYPWGDALEAAWCNVWESRYGGKLPADALPAGAAPNGVLQLIGNVWEWTDSPFELGGQLAGDADDVLNSGGAMKSVRGAAFDTYFTHEVAGTFRSGLPGLTRAPNVGFRCALDLREGE